ncbi:hypothetical protein Hamer_G004086 [Homarus americanus]|uniref:Uncharacterized protein n=1 Tax=Homarus americanus TaxID=6706 RepID=A0A8J5MPY5_HOMAM|nr:hypothetical protein Hamer_G004086 [Homarus americanus]
MKGVANVLTGVILAFYYLEFTFFGNYCTQEVLELLYLGWILKLSYVSWDLAAGRAENYRTPKVLVQWEVIVPQGSVRGLKVPSGDDLTIVRSDRRGDGRAQGTCRLTTTKVPVRWCVS